MSLKLEYKRDLESDELEEDVRRWLETKKNEGTRNVYKSAFKRYQEFTGMTAEELKQEIDEEFKKPPTERGSIEKRLKRWYQWLTKEKGLSENLGATYIGAIMSFYRFYNYRVNLSIGRELKPSRKHRRYNLTTEDIRKLVNHAKTLRDRAIILTLAQTGMDVSTLCSLKVRDVWKGLEENEVPLRLSLTRRKENVEYDTFLHPEAIDAIRAYLLERKRKYGKVELDEPLFIKEAVRPGAGFGKNFKHNRRKRNKIEAVTPSLIEKVFRQLAVETGLVTEEEIKQNSWNPVRPHALRRWFQDTLRLAGVNQEIIEYMVGHKLPYKGAYFSADALQAYKMNLDKLSIFGTPDEQTRLKLEALDQKQKDLEKQYKEALEKEIPKLVEEKIRNILIEFEVMKQTFQRRMAQLEMLLPGITEIMRDEQKTRKFLEAIAQIK